MKESPAGGLARLMNIPQEKEILLDIPSHDEIAQAGLSKSQRS
jgi:hypothetical protein